MKQKETTEQSDLLIVLEWIAQARIRFWLDGGWGVDVLVGRQTRPHRDIDLDFDAAHTKQLLTLLTVQGYRITTDEGPVRMELYHPEHGYLDLHPFELFDDGTARQAAPTGGWYTFTADLFGTAQFAGQHIPCISVKGQLLFHTGYPLRDKDRHDIPLIQALLPPQP